MQIYLNLAGRDPAGGGFQQVAAADGPRRSRRSRPRTWRSTDPNDWTRDGQPEGWKVIDRAFTKAEARYIPNGPGSTADMAHPTRTGDLVVFAYPPYQFDAATPGTLVAPSHFFGQHGYVPDVQNLDANINMRATFLAGGEDIGKGDGRRRARSTSRRRSRTCSASPSRSRARAGCCSTCSRAASGCKPVSIIGLNDFHGQLDPTTLRVRRHQRRRSAARRTSRRCSTRSSPRCRARA